MLSMATAHEVLPSITDMRAVDERVVFDVRANLESFVAGIDLSTTSDTNDTPEAASYDELRALSPEELAERFRTFWPQMAEEITLTADGAALAPTLDSVTAGPIGDVEIPRPSDFRFSAPLPEGAEIVQMGWGPEFGVMVLRQMDVPAPYDGYLEPGALSAPINLAGGDQASGWETFIDYIPVGFDHIVPLGLDHILFVLGLFFLAAQMRPLLIQVSLFTLAHTITLALAALGYVTISGDIVEPLIAASIAFVAIENIWARGISRWRPFVVFGFGLLHGLGFASVLGDFGLPDGTFIPALLGFNIGVEVGQLAVIAVMFLCVWQALRIDAGQNEAGRGFALYGVLAIVGVVLIAMNGAGVSAVLQNPISLLEDAALLFAISLVAVSLFCVASIQLRDQIDAYRRFVAIPSSVVIAIIGAYWFVERVFL